MKATSTKVAQAEQLAKEATSKDVVAHELMMSSNDDAQIEIRVG